MKNKTTKSLAEIHAKSPIVPSFILPPVLVSAMYQQWRFVHFICTKQKSGQTFSFCHNITFYFWEIKVYFNILKITVQKRKRTGILTGNKQC